MGVVMQVRMGRLEQELQGENREARSKCPIFQGELVKEYTGAGI